METILGIFGTEFWYIAPILVTATTALAGVINQGFKVDKAWLKQLISWVLGSGLSVGAWALNMISFGNPVWLGIVCLCVVVGLASNGVYDIPTIKNFINSWFVKKPDEGNMNPEVLTTTTTPEMMESTTTTTTTTPEIEDVAIPLNVILKYANGKTVPANDYDVWLAVGENNGASNEYKPLNYDYTHNYYTVSTASQMWGHALRIGNGGKTQMAVCKHFIGKKLQVRNNNNFIDEGTLYGYVILTENDINRGSVTIQLNVSSLPLYGMSTTTTTTTTPELMTTTTTPEMMESTTTTPEMMTTTTTPELMVTTTTPEFKQ